MKNLKCQQKNRLATCEQNIKQYKYLNTKFKMFKTSIEIRNPNLLTNYFLTEK